MNDPIIYYYNIIIITILYAHQKLKMNIKTVNSENCLQ